MTKIHARLMTRLPSVTWLDHPTKDIPLLFPDTRFHTVRSKMDALPDEIIVYLFSCK